jgi:exodeoxyribonuclease VIII
VTDEPLQLSADLTAVLNESVAAENRLGPGIYSIAAERYHAANGVSKSMLDFLANQTPAHLQAYLMGIAKEETPAMRFGTICHRALLEPDTYKEGFHVKPEGMRFSTKAGMEWQSEHGNLPIITQDESDQIDAMVSAVHCHPFAKRLLAGCQPEQSIFVEDHQGTLRKSRLDALTKGNVIPDLKTTESAALEGFERNVSRYRYHVQAAYYLDNCRLAGIEKENFFFICVEKIPPYLVRCLQMNGDVIEYGRNLYQRDIQIYRNCLESGRWPGWGDSYEEVALPPWELKAAMMAT